MVPGQFGQEAAASPLREKRNGGSAYGRVGEREKRDGVLTTGALQKRLDLTDLRPEDMPQTRFEADDCGAARRIYQPLYDREVDC